MALTNTTIKNIKPKNKPFKKADAKGLYLIVTPQGGKRWRFKYRYQYKEKCLSLGLYPDVSLSMARKRRDEQRRLLAEGIDPGAKRITEKSAQTEKNANSFEVVAREWPEKKKVGWSDEGRKVTRLFEKNIFPWIGNKAIVDLTVPELLKVLRRIEDRGALETVRKSLSYCSQIFRYGVSTGRLSNDPTINLRGAFKPPKSTHFSAVIRGSCLSVVPFV